MPSSFEIGKTYIKSGDRAKILHTCVAFTPGGNVVMSITTNAVSDIPLEKLVTRSEVYQFEEYVEPLKGTYWVLVVTNDLDEHRGPTTEMFTNVRDYTDRLSQIRYTTNLGVVYDSGPVNWVEKNQFTS